MEDRNANEVESCGKKGRENARRQVEPEEPWC